MPERSATLVRRASQTRVVSTFRNRALERHAGRMSCCCDSVPREGAPIDVHRARSTLHVDVLLISTMPWISRPVSAPPPRIRVMDLVERGRGVPQRKNALAHG